MPHRERMAPETSETCRRGSIEIQYLAALWWEIQTVPRIYGAIAPKSQQRYCPGRIGKQVF